MAKCSLGNLCLHLARSQKSKEWLISKKSACNHTLLNRKNKKVLVTYGRNSMSDLASSNGVAINDVNGRNWQHKTWCKCECCAPMESGKEGVCCLEILEICKLRFSSTSCLNVCRSDPYFVIWFSRRENFISYLIITQC